MKSSHGAEGVLPELHETVSVSWMRRDGSVEENEQKWEWEWNHTARETQQQPITANALTHRNTQIHSGFQQCASVFRLCEMLAVEVCVSVCAVQCVLDILNCAVETHLMFDVCCCCKSDDSRGRLSAVGVDGVLHGVSQLQEEILS